MSSPAFRDTGTFARNKGAVAAWLRKTELEALSLHYKTNDHLWFALFHELGHLLLHGKRLFVLEGIDGLDAKQEEEANHFAADQLIPQTAEYAAFKSGNLTQRAVQTFAAKLGISPGIVVGRLQNDGRIPWQSSLNQLKIHYNWVKKEG